MPRLVVTRAAGEGLDRCRRFLENKDANAGRRAAQTIARQFRLLERSPEIGRPLQGDDDLRELVIGFGKSGSVALYRHDAEADAIYVLAFRHQKEAGF